jgi:tRNA G10  N-methylase Trm11
LTKPTKLICGDFTDPIIRHDALYAVQDRPFDVIITDPPYGIREKISSSSSTGDNSDSDDDDDSVVGVGRTSSTGLTDGPLGDLFRAIADDRRAGTPLLRPDGGRVVAFVPVTEDQTIRRVLPPHSLCEQAGLQLVCSKEQKLNEKLSRWLVAYDSN